MMRKRILSIAMVTVMVLGLTGCTKTKTVSYTDENGNTTTTTTTTDKEGTTTVTENTDSEGNVTSREEDGYTASVVGSINEEQEPEYSEYESDEGYKITYYPGWFELVDDTDPDLDDSAYFRCTIDEDNMYENYMDVRLVTEYTADELIKGIAHQSGSDDTETFEGDVSFANATYYAYGCEEKISDTFIITTYAFQGKNGAYVIEIGSHIYSDDDEYAYKVSGAMEELFLSVELDM